MSNCNAWDADIEKFLDSVDLRKNSQSAKTGLDSIFTIREIKEAV